MTLRVSQALAELADREAIRDCLYRYSRGADRCDEEMLRSAYWENAYDDHCVFQGSREELVGWVMPLLKQREATAHNIDNILIRIRGGTADVESYFQGYHVMAGEVTPKAFLQGGRYLDKFEKRGDEWRIARRKVVVDWFRAFDDAGDWSTGPQGQPGIEPGGRWPEDDSYTEIELS